MSEQLNPQPEDPAQRLARLDLQVDDLLTCVRAGIAARRTATSNHPRAFGGWLDYGERIATLREILTLRGWTKREPNGMCLVVHPEQRFAIMTALGTAGTGTSAPVTTRRPRGGTTEKVVRINGQLELELDLGSQAPPSSPANPIAMPTWVLLVFEDEHEVRGELSLARHMSEEGYIDEWVERIPLPATRINDLLDDTGDDDEPDAGPEFDVPER